jgi:hypothetical protein
MLDPASITAATIVGYAAPKLLDAALAKVGEGLTETALTRVRQTGEQLRQAIVGRAKPEQQQAVSQALEAADRPEQRQKLEKWLEAGMNQNAQFAQELRQLAQAIQQVIQVGDVQAKNVQQVFGGQGIMAPDAQAPIMQADKIDKIEFNY